MKTRVLLLLGLYLCGMSVLAVAKDKSWDGWISDSKCGAKGANASHEQCAKKCIGEGAKPVFVSDTDQKVTPLQNPDAVKDHIGHHVQISGDMTKDGMLHVESVKMLSQ